MKAVSLYTALLLGVLTVASADNDRQAKGGPRKLLAFPVVVPDGSLLVLKQGKNIAMVTVLEQRSEPEELDFRFRYRTDGVLPVGDSERIHAGKVENVDTLKFGPFECLWSINREGRGFVYFHTEREDPLWIALVVEPDLRDRLTRTINEIMLISEEGGSILGTDLQPAPEFLKRQLEQHGEREPQPDA